MAAWGGLRYSIPFTLGGLRGVRGLAATFALGEVAPELISVGK